MFEEFAKRALRLAFIAGEPQRATAQQIERGLVRATKRLQPLDDLRGSLRRAPSSLGARRAAISSRTRPRFGWL